MRGVDIMITIVILRIILVSEILLQNIAVLYYLIKDYKRNYTLNYVGILFNYTLNISVTLFRA